MRRSVVTLLVASAVAGAPAASAPSETPRDGGIIVFGANEPSCLNDFFVLGCQTNADPGASLWALKGAFKLARDYTLQPDLVSSVEFTTKPPFTLTYHIRPEARWSDGVPVSAKDFVFTHRAILKYIPTSPDFPIHLTMVRSVRALYAKTVRVVLRMPVADWRSFLFDQILPRHALLGEDLTSIWKDAIDNPKTGEPIGSGPFLVEHWERGKQLTLVRNERYSGPHPAYLKRLVYRFRGPDFAGDPTEVLRDGDRDIYWSGVGRQEDYRPIPGYRRHFWPGGNLEHFQIRVGPGGHPALRSKLVRRALAYGIDRVSIVRSLYGEIDPTLGPLDSMVFRTGSRLYTPNWSSYRYRPTEARRLLEQARCRRGADRIYVCGGQKLSLRLFTTAGITRRVLTIGLVQGQLRRVGIEVKPSYYPADPLFEQILPSGDYDIALFSYFTLPNLSGLDVAGSFGCGYPGNWTGYCQRRVARDLNRARRIFDGEQQARLLNRADAQLARDVPVIPLFQPPIAVYVNSNLRNYFDRFPYHRWNAESWWLER
jgi:peptide/nickel transport system substrate-binding protein